MKMLPFRLLPATIIVLAALLGTKSIELVWAAMPIQTQQAFPAAAPPAAHPETAQPTPAPPTDVERRLLQDLRQRREQLDQREHVLDRREATLIAAEKKLDQRIAELQALQQQLKMTLAERKQHANDASRGMQPRYSMILRCRSWWN
jgi:type IV secretory pathway VirB10-like protein